MAEPEVQVLLKGLPGNLTPETLSEIARRTVEKVFEIERNRGGMVEFPENPEVSVTFVGDDDIRELNFQYLGKDEPTDVLAFSMKESVEGEPEVVGGPPEDILGDVVVSVETAERQACEYGQTVEAEVALLVAHGVLHLLGYDDCEPGRAAVMEEAQRRVLVELGY